MKTIKFIIPVFTFILLIAGCSKDDDDLIEKIETITEEINKVPSMATLSFPVNESELISSSPLLEWEKAIDPEGGNLIYEVQLGLDESNLITLANNLTTNQYQLETQLEKGITYNWKVIAKDSKGNNTDSNINTFTTEHITPNLITNNAPFSKRKFSTTTVFKGKIWAIGGEDENGNMLSDIWSSEDGENWQMNTADAPFGSRKEHNTIVFNEKMWLYSGMGKNIINENIFKKDIWSTTDGVNWTKESNDTLWDNVPFYQQHGTMFVFDDLIWRFAGYNGSVGDLTEERYIWNSNDGRNWNLISENHGFDQKHSMEVIPFQGKLIGLEGNPLGDDKFNKIWESNDGINWELVADTVPFQIGYYAEAVIFNDKLFMTAGAFYDELWFTEDGIEWIKATADRGYEIRYANNTVIFNDKIYVVGGGTHADEYNDVWILD